LSVVYATGPLFFFTIRDVLNTYFSVTVPIHLLSKLKVLQLNYHIDGFILIIILLTLTTTDLQIVPSFMHSAILLAHSCASMYHCTHALLNNLF